MGARAHAQTIWTSTGGDSAHQSLANAAAMPHGAASNEAPALGPWVVNTDEFAREITLIPSQTPVFDENHVYVSARVVSAEAWRLLAVRRANGTVAWSGSIPSPLVDSFSSPVVDKPRNAVIVASRRDLVCFDAMTGAERWRRTLNRNVVNASPIVVDDVPGRARVFITDYDGYGVNASLYCYNLDPESYSNPFDPGDLVWRITIGGASGATPAFLPASAGGAGLVYVATRGEPGFAAGNILAFDAHSDTPPSPAFIATNAISEGFYGTICVAPPKRDADAPILYAVSYEFYAGLDSANLLSIDGISGAVRWSAPCNRGASAPVALGNGRVAVSAGIPGYGTLPTVALYLDRVTHAVPLWNSASGSWSDANEDGLVDPGECLVAGLWSYQPAASSDQSLLCVGIPPMTGEIEAFGSALASLDLALRPSDREFMRAIPFVSGSPSVAIGNWYAISAAGLMARVTPRPDVGANGRVSIDDLAAFEHGSAPMEQRDVDGDGAATDGDRRSLLNELRFHEGLRMQTGRP